jgi:hypothetical protein
MTMSTLGFYLGLGIGTILGMFVASMLRDCKA